MSDKKRKEYEFILKKKTEMAINNVTQTSQPKKEIINYQLPEKLNFTNNDVKSYSLQKKKLILNKFENLKVFKEVFKENLEFYTSKNIEELEESMNFLRLSDYKVFLFEF